MRRSGGRWSSLVSLSSSNIPFRSLGLLSKSVDNEEFCSALTFLTAAQREFCATNSQIFSIIHRSLRSALDECRYQFRHSRWNCSIFDRSSDVGKLVLKSSSSNTEIRHPDICFLRSFRNTGERVRLRFDLGSRDASCGESMCERRVERMQLCKNAAATFDEPKSRWIRVGRLFR